MQVQITLENKQAQIQEKPWKGICCRRCWFAKTDPKKCKCRCRGTNHQKGVHKAIELLGK
jgi:hypothetical protein